LAINKLKTIQCGQAITFVRPLNSEKKYKIWVLQVSKLICDYSGM
jgi:hypothetical protein